jgi:hypothetical protein
MEEKSMAGHEANWQQIPDFSTRNIGQYHCSKGNLLLTIGYNLVEAATGWYWEIRDADNQIVDSVGNKYVEIYESAVGLFDDVKDEGVQRFDSLPCRRPN